MDGQGFERLIVEKPFGTDLETASQLNKELEETFDEEQIFRIDHYLGKEMIQNIFAIRFGNLIFDNLWNRDFIDNIQITFAERLGVEERGGYYDHSGALRDMVQNHTLQLLSLLAMDKPATFTKDAIRAEKVKVFEQMHNPTDEELKKFFIRGQYHSGTIEGKKISLIAVNQMSILNLLRKPMLLELSLLIAIGSKEYLSSSVLGNV